MLQFILLQHLFYYIAHETTTLQKLLLHAGDAKMRLRTKAVLETTV